MKPVDAYFFNQKEPYQSIMLYLRSVILKTLPNIDERYSYKIPFYNIDKKPMLYINVLKGTWWVSTGPASDVYNPDNMKKVEAGTFIYEPPNGHHYDMAKDEEVVVQISGMGPVITTSIPQ